MVVSVLRMAISLVPLMPAHRSERAAGPAIPTFNVESGSATVADMAVAALAGVAAGDVRWRISVARPNQSTGQTCRLTADGRFLGMSEMLPLLWPRDLVPTGGE